MKRLGNWYCSTRASVPAKSCRGRGEEEGGEGGEDEGGEGEEGGRGEEGGGEGRG